MARCEAPDQGSSSLAQGLGLRSTGVPSARGAGFSRQATLLLPHRRAAFFAKFDRLAQGCRGCSRLCCCVHILSRTSAMQSGMANRPQHSAQCCWCTRIPVLCIACQRGFDVADGFLATILGLVLMEIAVKSSPSGSEAFTLSLLLSVFNLADAVSDYFGALLYDGYTASFFFHLVWINAACTAATALIAPSLMRWIGIK